MQSELTSLFKGQKDVKGEKKLHKGKCITSACIFPECYPSNLIGSNTENKERDTAAAEEWTQAFNSPGEQRHMH